MVQQSAKKSPAGIHTQRLRNLVLSDIEINNLYDDTTVLGISVMTDFTNRYMKLFDDFEVKKGEKFAEETLFKCFEWIIIKVETSEGFHTKEIKCEDPRLGKPVRETFVPRMSSMIKKVEISSDYDTLANDMIAPLEGEFVEDSADYLKSFDLNEAVSTGLTKPSYDEEIMQELKKSSKSFNLITLNFEYRKTKTFIGKKRSEKAAVECSDFKHGLFFLVGYPPYILLNAFGFEMDRFWEPYQCV